jgi:hypothetical protein
MFMVWSDELRHLQTKMIMFIPFISNGNSSQMLELGLWTMEVLIFDQSVDAAFSVLVSYSSGLGVVFDDSLNSVCTAEIIIVHLVKL